MLEKIVAVIIAMGWFCYLVSSKLCLNLNGKIIISFLFFLEKSANNIQISRRWSTIQACTKIYTS